jgi:hypothetical protein
MGLNDVPRCQHLKVNGTQCGSPALRRKRRCYFHEGVRAEGVKLKTDPYARYEFEMPLLEDANGVQVALMRVLQMLAGGTMDAKKAGLMLYGLQTASANLKNARFEAEKVTDVVIDCKSVGQTCIHGPQWFAGDFAEPAEEVEVEVEVKRDSVAAAGGEEVVGEVDGEPVAQASVVKKEVERARVGREKIRQQKSSPAEGRAGQRKRPGPANLDDEPNSLAKLLLQQLGLPLPGEELGAASGSM